MDVYLVSNNNLQKTVFEMYPKIILDFFLIPQRYLLAGSGLFFLGLLIGLFAHTSPVQPPVPPSESADLLEELLREITADKINALEK